MSVSLDTSSTLPQESPAYAGRIERGVREMYAEDDLGGACLFSGDFINFGFWPKNIEAQNEPLTVQQRLESQQELYRQVAAGLDIRGDDTVVEVGSGRGVGAGLVAKEFKPKTLIGVDFCKEQVARAAKINAVAVEQGKIKFTEGDAQDLPFEDGSIDRVYSVEAAQHFPSAAKFVQESSRVLKSQGKLCVAAFFGCHDMAKAKVAPLVQTVDAEIDRLPSIESIKTAMQAADFTDIKIQSIGGRVWAGFDKWVSQTELSDSWTRNWKVAYEAGDLDYYMIQGTKK